LAGPVGLALLMWASYGEIGAKYGANPHWYGECGKKYGASRRWYGGFGAR